MLKHTRVYMQFMGYNEDIYRRLCISSSFPWSNFATKSSINIFIVVIAFISLQLCLSVRTLPSPAPLFPYGPYQVFLLPPHLRYNAIISRNMLPSLLLLSLGNSFRQEEIIAATLLLHSSYELSIQQSIFSQFFKNATRLDGNSIGAIFPFFSCLIWFFDALAYDIPDTKLLNPPYLPQTIVYTSSDALQFFLLIRNAHKIFP